MISYCASCEDHAHFFAIRYCILLNLHRFLVSCVSMDYFMFSLNFLMFALLEHLHCFFRLINDLPLGLLYMY